MVAPAAASLKTRASACSAPLPQQLLVVRVAREGDALSELIDAGDDAVAGDASADRVGGLIGDFVKGPLPGNLAPDLAAGVALHRRIDSFAETHPAFRASRARVSAERRRVAGIMVDLFYDHFMAIHWSRFHAAPLSAYVAGLYRLLADEPCLPERFREFLPRMREEDWLSGYRSVERIAGALDRMAELL